MLCVIASDEMTMGTECLPSAHRRGMGAKGRGAEVGRAQCLTRWVSLMELMAYRMNCCVRRLPPLQKRRTRRIAQDIAGRSEDGAGKLSGRSDHQWLVHGPNPDLADLARAQRL